MIRPVLGPAVLVAVAAAGPVAAQPPLPRGAGAELSRPAFSPYLNLLRGDGSAALNYFGMVRPQVDARRALIGLEGQVQSNRQAITGLQAGMTGIPGTGHGTTFLNTGGYFLGGGATGGGFGGGGRNGGLGGGGLGGGLGRGGVGAVGGSGNGGAGGRAPSGLRSGRGLGR